MSGITDLDFLIKVNMEPTRCIRAFSFTLENPSIFSNFSIVSVYTLNCGEPYAKKSRAASPTAVLYLLNMFSFLIMFLLLLISTSIFLKNKVHPLSGD
jgi:hypothetical protein